MAVVSAPLSHVGGMVVAPPTIAEPAYRGLWSWFTSLLTDPSLRATVQVVMIDYDVDDDGQQTQVERTHFYLSNCVPVKMKAPALSAKDGLIAIEELQVAYESLSLTPPQAA